MFISSAEYKMHIDTLINQSQTIDIAVAFWGKGAFEYLQGTGKQFRILCNLTSGGTNPEVIESLVGHGYEVRQTSDLHAKVIVGKSIAVVGSANFSTNGLNIESEEFDGWQEAGYMTDRPEDLAKMRDWFAAQWNEAEEVNETHLKEAHANWERRCRSRVSLSTRANSVLAMTPAELQGRNIYVAFYRDPSSDEAHEVFDAWKERLTSDSSVASETGLDFFEDWDGMKPDQLVISVYVGSKGGLRVDGAYRILKNIRKKRRENRASNKWMTLHVCEDVPSLADRDFGKVECSELAAKLRKSGWRLPADLRAQLIPLEELVAEI